MKKLIILISIFLLFPLHAEASYDPTSEPNNKFGIHILDVTELEDAAKLVNTSGGDWGYVLVPIQAGDKDIRKWQDFMDKSRSLHLIPILRLATEGDYFNTTVWRKPNPNDVVDFANFLSSINWHTKNRYIIVFNEVNRADEWGGEVNPAEYARLLSLSVSSFKSRSSDFFIISAGMDNASVDNGVGDMNEYTYFSLMNEEVPGIFNQIDAISSHSYPNPAFSTPPSLLTGKSVDTFLTEQQFVESISNKKPLVFITETGWDQEIIGQSQTAQYFYAAINNTWNDSSIVAITPFLLRAGGGPFKKFSFMNENGSPNDVHKLYSSIQKTKGRPRLNENKKVLSSSSKRDLPVKDFKNTKQYPVSKMHIFEKTLRLLIRG